jgi:hypothetical protein
MKAWLQLSSDPLSLGNSLRCAFRSFTRGLLMILYGFIFQLLGQLMVFVAIVCIWQDVDERIGQKVFTAARFGNAIGIALTLYGRRRCLEYSPPIRGRWLLVAAIILDAAAFVALISPPLVAFPNLREIYFLFEAASVALFLIFLGKLSSVIQISRLKWLIAACLAAGAASLLTYGVILALIPPARVAGPALLLIRGNSLAVLWSLSAAIFTILYCFLLWRLRHVLRELDRELLTHAVTSYLTSRS